MIRTKLGLENICSKLRQTQKSFPIISRVRLTEADSDFLDHAPGLGCETTSCNSVPEVLIKSENAVQTNNIVDIRDVDEIFSSGKAMKIKDNPAKSRNVLKTVVVDVKIKTFGKRKFHEAPDAKLNSLKQKN